MAHNLISIYPDLYYTYITRVRARMIDARRATKFHHTWATDECQAIFEYTTYANTYIYYSDVARWTLQI